MPVATKLIWNQQEFHVVSLVWSYLKSESKVKNSNRHKLYISCTMHLINCPHPDEIGSISETYSCNGTHESWSTRHPRNTRDNPHKINYTPWLSWVYVGFDLNAFRSQDVQTPRSEAPGLVPRSPDETSDLSSLWTHHCSDTGYRLLRSWKQTVGYHLKSFLLEIQVSAVRLRSETMC